MQWQLIYNCIQSSNICVQSSDNFIFLKIVYKSVTTEYVTMHVYNAVPELFTVKWQLFTVNSV